MYPDACMHQYMISEALRTPAGGFGFGVLGQIVSITTSLHICVSWHVSGNTCSLFEGLPLSMTSAGTLWACTPLYCPLAAQPASQVL